MARSVGKVLYVRVPAFFRRIVWVVFTCFLGASAQGQPPTAGSSLHFFNGQQSYVDIPGYGNVAPTNEITIEFWERTAPYQPESTLSLTPDVVTDRISVDVPFVDGNVYWDFGDITGGGRLNYVPPITMLGSWQHFAFVASLSGSNSPYGPGVAYMAIYRNGVLEADQPGMTPFTPYAADLTLGTFLDYSLYFSGDLDEVRIWNIALSQSNILSTMHHTLVGNEPGLVAYWRLDEGSGTNAADATGNGNTGTLVNQPSWVYSSAPMDTPVMTLNGPNPMTNGCSVAYVEPGATVNAMPLGIGVGPQYGLVIRPDGSLAEWGGAQFDISRNYLPHSSLSYSRLTAISAARDYALGVGQFSPGEAAWGNGSEFSISFTPPAVPAVAITAGYQHWMWLFPEGNLNVYGSDDFGQSTPPGGQSWMAVAAGGFHSLGLLPGGTVLGWGDNNDVNGDYAGQATPPSLLSNVVAIAAGGYHSLALQSDGMVVGWGDNNDENGDYLGQATPPASLTNVVAIAAGLYFSMALQANGTVVAWGDDSFNQTNIPASVSNVIAIAAGDESAVVLRADRTVITWGDGYTNTIPVATNANTLPVTITGTVNTNMPGTYYIYYTSGSNEYGLAAPQAVRTVVIADINPPVVTLLGANPMSVVQGGVFTDPGATANDACVGDVTASIVVLGSVNTAIPGNYSLTYSATNSDGIVGTATRTVWVTPNTPYYPTSQFPISDAVNPNGSDTMAYFQYGLTTSYGSSTTPQDLGSGSNPVPFNLTLINLLPGTTYHYDLVTITGGSTNYGPDMTFTTSPYLVPGDVDGDGIVDQIDLGIVMGYYWPLGMTNVSGLSTTNIQFVLAYTNNWDLNVEVSTNLIDWSFLGLAYPFYQFSDPDATNLPQRYYRLRWP